MSESTALIPRPLPSTYIPCGARTRSGGICRKVAGHGTSHPGQGKCKFHGGASPILHGRYSKIKRDNIRELIEKHENDPDPLDMLPELASARALFEDFVNRYDEWREALLAWWESWQIARRPVTKEMVDALIEVTNDAEKLYRLGGNEVLTQKEKDKLYQARAMIRQAETCETAGRPRHILDIGQAHEMLDSITKIIDRIERIKASNAISRNDLIRVMTEMGRVVEARVKDPEVREQIQEGWLAINVA